ncbi:MAG TPA: histidine ammonia-lyase, partial [Chloroflexi bacterium]|nr:histidine ammonia-lyase [Chloroflexota bacterium]
MRRFAPRHLPVQARSMTILTIDCQPLTITDVVAVARHGTPVRLGDRSKLAMARSRDVVDRLVERKEVVYGITTGFGKFADRVIPAESLEKLQSNLILSHSVGVGDPLPPDVVRAMMV